MALAWLAQIQSHASLNTRNNSPQELCPETESLRCDCVQAKPLSLKPKLILLEWECSGLHPGTLASDLLLGGVYITGSELSKPGLTWMGHFLSLNLSDPT